MSADPIQKLAANNELPERPRRGCALVLGLMALWLAMLAGVTAWGGEPFAYILCPHRPINEAPAAVPYKSYVDVANVVGPMLKANGVTRLFLHNPGGIYAIGWMGEPLPGPDNFYGKDQKYFQDALKRFDAREMRLDQWWLAKTIRAPYANDAAFKQAAKILSDNGVKELLIYVGGPFTFDSVQQCEPHLNPFLGCATETMRVSIGLDTLTATDWGFKHIDHWTREDQWYTDLCKWIRLRGGKVYGEPRMRKDLIPALGKHIDGTIATREQDAGVDLAGQPGETIQVVPFKAAVPAGVTPAWRVDQKVTLTVTADVNWGAK